MKHTKARMERRKKVDPEGYRIYGLGEWGEVGGLILSNYVVEDFDTNPERFDYMVNSQDLVTITQTPYLT